MSPDQANQERQALVERMFQAGLPHMFIFAYIKSGVLVSEGNRPFMARRTTRSAPRTTRGNVDP
jgi:hypothetical protein